jgi:hypothetical protein
VSESEGEAREARLALSDQREGAMRMVPGARIACRPQSTRRGRRSGCDGCRAAPSCCHSRASRMCAGACRAIVTTPRYEPAMMLEAVMRRSGNVVWLHEPHVPIRTAARSQPERGLADVFVVGGLLTGLAFTAQQLVLALSMG